MNPDTRDWLLFALAITAAVIAGLFFFDVI